MTKKVDTKLAKLEERSRQRQTAEESRCKKEALQVTKEGTVQFTGTGSSSESVDEEAVEFSSGPAGEGPSLRRKGQEMLSQWK